MSLTPDASVSVVEFTHVKPYADVATSPIVELELAAVNAQGVLTGTSSTGLIVDSGAEVTMLGAEIAVRLGIDLADERYPRGTARGIVAGAGIITVEVPVMVLICDRWIEIPTLFVPSPMPVRPLLGRRGVFDRVSFGFRHRPGALLAGL